MKRLLFYSLLALVLSSCAGYKLEKTVWTTLSGFEKDGERATLITSLLFRSSEKVDIYNAVVVDTNIVVTPFKYAECKYKLLGTTKKKTKIEIEGKDIKQQSVQFTGKCDKNEMLLLSQDSLLYLYVKEKDVVIK